MRNNKVVYLKALIIFVMFFCIVGCNNSADKVSNGWYFMDEIGEKISGDPIVTAEDFDELRLDSVLFENNYQYEIIGKLKPEKIKIFEDATKKAIGKYIGFLYNGEIITKPMINLPIESGNFSITGKYINDKDKIMEIYSGLKIEMKSN